MYICTHSELQTHRSEHANTGLHHEVESALALVQEKRQMAQPNLGGKMQEERGSGGVLESLPGRICSVLCMPLAC